MGEVTQAGPASARSGEVLFLAPQLNAEGIFIWCPGEGSSGRRTLRSECGSGDTYERSRP